MNKFAIKIACVLLGALSPNLYAATPQDIAGVYDDSGADSLMQQFLLADGGYCLVVSAGMLDVNLAGKWQIDDKLSKKDKTVITIQPEALVKTPYPVWLNKNEKRDTRTLKFISRRFESNGVQNVIGFGEQANKPNMIAPIFDENSDPKPQYEMPIPKNANYLFVGYLISEGQYQLTRYKIGKDIKNTIQLSFDFNAFYADKMQGTAMVYKNDVLTELEGMSSHGITKQPLDTQDSKSIREQCIDPILKGDATELFPENSELLEPTTIKWQGKTTQPSWY